MWPAVCACRTKNCFFAGDTERSEGARFGNRGRFKNMVQNLSYAKKFNLITVIFISCCIFQLPSIVKGEISDTFTNSDNLVAELNSKVTVENGKATMMRTANGDCVVDWHRAIPVKLNKSSDRIEIVTSGPVEKGSYTVWILFFDNNGKFITEKQWLDKISDSSTQVLPSVIRFAADNDVQNPARFWVRFRIFNVAGDGFVFDAINVKERTEPSEKENAKYEENVVVSPKPVERVKGTDKYVYAHFLTWFKTREFSGQWEMWKSDYNDAVYNPDTILENGRHDVATTSYPLTDVYDSSDPIIIEYQFLLMKLSGIDGIIVDLDGRRINPYRHQCLMTIVPYLEKYNLKLILCFEEWCGYWPKGTYPNRDAEIKAAADEIGWMMDNFVDKPFYGTVDDRKPVLVFRKIADQWFNVKEWAKLAPLITGKGGALIFDDSQFSSFAHVSDGKFFWVGGFQQGSNTSTLEYCIKGYKHFFNRNDGVARTSPPYVLGSATPAFNDTPVWGWGAGPHIAPDYKGKRFTATWELSIDNKADLVQLVTWNDWNEGTQIEPSDTYGYKYLELNKKFTAKYKGNTDKVPDEALRIPIKLFQLRKANEKLTDSDKKKITNEKLDAVRDALLNGRYADASSMIDSVQKEKGI
jgi:glycoprotein endo-alpha-1,2-mannosidase